MNFELKNSATFGVAGNFTGHLEQAGEASDFTNVKVAEDNAPKAIFPTYMPKHDPKIPEFLSVYPFDEYRIIFPKGEQKLQIEPECAIVFKASYEGDTLVELKPLVFGASNDCSIRKQGAKKISEKKNWGHSSKGLASNLIKIDSFDDKGVLSRYKIASFLIRDGVINAYGEDSFVNDYSYMYDKLLSWMLDKFNHQEDLGPAENIHNYLLKANKPEHIVVSIGATRYTEYGKTHFLTQNDRSVVVLYPSDVYTFEQIVQRLQKDNLEEDDISVLDQQVVLS